MTQSLTSWERKYHTECDGESFLFYVAFGEIAHDQPLSSSTYRCGGIPDGFELSSYDKVDHTEYLNEYFHGYVWERLCVENPELARAAKQSPGCLILRGSQKNPETLDYLRDCVGLLTFFLDNGACAIYDPQMLHWWSPELWREQIFDPAESVPRHHVVILHSQDEQSPEHYWFHTRGMRKFGRPDLSVRRVGAKYHDAVIDLCNRFIEYQAFGGFIPELQEVRMASLPAGGMAHHGGDFDDLDFNNIHVEFVWPEPGLTGDRL